jgi:hypothetical protein
MTARKSLLVLVSCLGALMLVACSPFDPDLGNAPYLCAGQEPRCPEIYSCLEDGAGRAVCVQMGGMLPDAGPDGPPGGFQCAPDGMLEPNNAIDEAYQTDVGINAPTRAFGPISLCPEGDRDHYQINLTAANKGIEVITRWETGMPVTCAILNQAGTSVNNCTAMGLNARRACAANLTTPGSPNAVFYAVAFSTENHRNNYKIEMRVVDNCVQP